MFHQLLTRTFLRFSRYATEPEDSEEWRLKKIIGMVAVSAGVLSWLANSLLAFAFNERLVASVCIGAGVLFFLGLLSYNVFRRYSIHFYYWFFVTILALILIHLLLGGFAQSGVVLIWLLIFPIGALVVYRPRHGVTMFLVVAAIFVSAAFLQPYYLRTTNSLPPAASTALFVSNILGVSTYILLGGYYYVWRNEVLRRSLLGEQEKAEALLLNILPKEIATILKNENRVIADQFEGASILFADVVNFTPLSAKMTPNESVELLNEVYSYIDGLVEKYGLEKIKTIGDCYMVAAGVPRRRPDHAPILTQLALDIRDYVSQHEFRGQRLVFRIGLNSGPVVAGVIGRKKFIYDLWGDAVNTASRMESHGVGGFVQITEATYELIKNDFICEARGRVDVKGKGEMNVWYVLKKKA